MEGFVPTYYKVLKPGRVGPYSAWQWPAIGIPCPTLTEPLVPCQIGYHACRVEHLAYWLTPTSEVYEVELGPDVRDHSIDKVYSRYARLTKQIPFTREDWVRLGVETDLVYARASKSELLRHWAGRPVAGEASAVWWKSVWGSVWASGSPWARQYGNNFLALLQEKGIS